MTPIVKQPGESLSLSMPFETSLGGATIATVDGVTATAKGLVTELTPLAISGVGHDGKTVTASFAGGTDGEFYLVRVRVTDSAGNALEEDRELHCLDLAFVVPDPVGTPYVTPQAYVDRFGVEETVRLTDDLGVGVVGKAALFGAIADASAEIDGYLARRYNTPLDPIPPLIEKVAADIARYNLHGDAIPEPVAQRHGDAVKTLDRIAKGIVRLSGTAERETGRAGTPQFCKGTNRPFSDGALDDF